MLQIISRPSTFRVGQSVRYFSSGLRCWVSATIQSFNLDGSMNLDEPVGVRAALAPVQQVRIRGLTGVKLACMNSKPRNQICMDSLSNVGVFCCRPQQLILVMADGQVLLTSPPPLALVIHRAMVPVAGLPMTAVVQVRG